MGMGGADGVERADVGSPGQRGHRRQVVQKGRLGHSLEDHRRWPNAFYLARGLFTMTEAHALARQSR